METDEGFPYVSRAATNLTMRTLAVLATTSLLAACAPERPAAAPAAEGGEAASQGVQGVAPVSLARLRLGPVADGAIGPLVIDDGARTALVLASPLGEGRFRIDLAIEGEGPALARTVAETLQPPRGFSLALGPRGGLLAWIEGEKRNAVVSAVALAADGAPLAGTRRMPQGRVEPYWVTARVDDGRRVLFVAEQDASGAALRLRSVGEDGEPLAAPVGLAKRAVAWATHADLPLVVVREEGAALRLEVYAPEARGGARIIATARFEGVPARAVRRVDVTGRGDASLVALTVNEPVPEVLCFRPSKGVLARVGRVEGRVVAADETSSLSLLLVAKAFPSREGASDLALVHVVGDQIQEKTLPPSVSLPGDGSVPPGVVSLGPEGFALTTGADEARSSFVRVGDDGAVSRVSGALGAGPGWNLRLRSDALRMTRFEARGSGVDVVDGPPERETIVDEPRRVETAAPPVRSLFPTSSARITAASLGETTYVLRLEPSVEAPKEDDVNAQSLRLFAVAERGPTVDDRVTDRAQPTGTISLAARSAGEGSLVVSWLARERGVQQAHALVLDAKACKVQPCDPLASGWPLARKRHRQITKAGGDITEVLLVPTPEGYLGAWIEQSGREAAVVAATYDGALERTSKFERVSSPGSLATDLVAVHRGAGVWLGWIDGKGARADEPRAVPTLARVAMHDARVELKPRTLTPRAGEGLAGALALANHEAGVIAAFLEREGAEAARRADEGDSEGAPAFLTVQLLDERGDPVGEPVQRGGDGEGMPCDLALSATTFALERCRPSSFTLEAASIVVTKEGVSLAAERTLARGLRPATQDRPLAVDDRRVLWLQNDEAGNPWLRSFPLEGRRTRAADQK